jgi:hypothetical protein
METAFRDLRAMMGRMAAVDVSLIVGAALRLVRRGRGRGKRREAFRVYLAPGSSATRWAGARDSRNRHIRLLGIELRAGLRARHAPRSLAGPRGGRIAARRALSLARLQVRLLDAVIVLRLIRDDLGLGLVQQD